MLYNKLIRDNIPDIIRKKGQMPLVHIATETEFWQKLKEKLSEEVEEFVTSEDDDEIIDILEIIHTIYDFRRIDIAELEKRRKAKREERGGFLEIIILDEVR